MEELISIITPVYNVERYLPRCIESILLQTYSKWELILINDGSSDQSGIVCEQYAEKDNRIKVIHQTNKGVSTARNVGIEASKGNYVIFVDPDDWLAPNMLEAMIMEGREADLVVCGFTKIYHNEDGTDREVVKRIWTDHQKPFFSADLYYDVLCKSAMMCNKLFKRSAISQIRFLPDVKYGEDALFVTHALPFIHNAVLIPEPYYYYFWNREGNVVSAVIDDRSIQLLNTSILIYQETKKHQENICGVRRVYMAVNEIVDKIDYKDKEKEYNYLKACCDTLRKTDLKDRIKYVFDKHFEFRPMGMIARLLVPYSPALLFRIFKGRYNPPSV